MGVDFFVGRSQAWLEEKLAEAQEALADGGDIVSGGVGEVNFTREDRIRLPDRIQRILHSLSLRDPEKYPPSVYQGQDRTVARLRV